MEGVEKELDREALIALVLERRGQLADLHAENARLRRRIDQLQGKGPTRRPAEPYSLRAEEQRREQAAGSEGRKKRRRRQKSARRGRHATQEKLDQAERACVVLPEGLTIGECIWVRERPVWRIENGRAVRVAYDIYRGPQGQLPDIEGVPARSEYGLEIHVSVAFLVLVIGLSMDKVCGLLKFFWKLELSKSQADALLRQGIPSTAASSTGCWKCLARPAAAPPTGGSVTLAGSRRSTNWPTGCASCAAIASPTRANRPTTPSGTS